MLTQSFERTIRQLCEDVLSEPVPQNIPEKVIHHIQKTFPVEWSTLWLTEQKNIQGDKRLRLAAAAGEASKLLTAEGGGPAVYDFGEGLTGAIAEGKETVNITKPEDFDRFPHRCKYDQVMYCHPKAGTLCRCVLGVPLILKSPPGSGTAGADDRRVIGVLKLENIRRTPDHRENYFTQRDVEIVEGYAAVIAVALEKAQMRADSVRIAQGLLDVSQNLLARLGEPSKLDEIIRQTANVISAEACALWLRSGVELQLKAAYGYSNSGDKAGVPPYYLEEKCIPDDFSNRPTETSVVPEEEKYRGVGLTVYVAKTTKPLNLRTLEQVRGHFAWKGANDQRMWGKTKGEACYSLVAIPLIDNETKDLKGVFKIENKRPTIFQLQSYFSDEDERLLTTLGNSISLSLINSERIDRLQRLELLVGNVRVLDNLETALFFVLTGLTHEKGLLYNRAMVFLKDDTKSRLICRFAVGQIEARDWDQEMEREPAHWEMDRLLQEFNADNRSFFACPMMGMWRGKEILLGNRETQVIARHAHEKNCPTRKYLSGSLTREDALFEFAKGDFVLIPIRVDGELLGIIYADNRFTGNRVDDFECEVLDLFAGMAGAIIQASKVPDRLRAERDHAWRTFSALAAHRLGTETCIIDTEVDQHIQPDLGRTEPDSQGRVFVRKSLIGDSLQIIRQSVNRLRQAVRDYQQLSSEPEPCEVFDFCRLIEATSQSTTKNFRGINVRSVFREQPIMIHGRPGQLTYLLEELFINAWKEVDPGFREPDAGDRESIDVLVEVWCQGPDVVCLVVDNGPGIPLRLCPSLFKKHGKARRGGTGLGLYIIGQIVEDHKGKIELVADGKPPGYGGACFRITLPLSRRGQAENKVVSLQDTAAGGPYILVVEDNPDLRRQLCDLLGQHGMHCLATRNELEAEVAVGRFPGIRAIVADVDLSEAGGHERGGLRLIKNLSAVGVNIPSVLISCLHLDYLARTPEYQELFKRDAVGDLLNRNSADFASSLVRHVKNACEAQKGNTR